MLLVSLVVLALLVVCSVMIGARPVAFDAVLQILTGSDDPRLRVDSVVIWTLRLPRTVLAIVVGAALGVAGALIQAVTRNPLADPGIIGVNAGAALLVVLAVSVFGWSGVLATTGAGMLGALAALLAVAVLSTRSRMSPLVLVLAGTALAAAVGGVTSGLLILDSGALDQVRFWTVGSLAGRDPELIWPSVALVTLAVLVGGAIAVRVNTLALGDEMAKSLGTSVARTRAIAVVVVAVLCGAATAAAGPIGFVGLAVPFAARLVAGLDTRWVILLSLSFGAVLLLAADVVGRVIAGSGELEAGIVVAAVGAPLFIALALRQRMERL
ncbi:iron chelate uptake ABC transporter family permease subunit [Herbiconiux moechotypicola]|uniref:Iron chelate uptake ABC transporter family permease subunit n=1 Tax=Herbiconiux moechotypicola TaxID=637393 RepID=A0ABN3DU00_9MICO